MNENHIKKMNDKLNLKDTECTDLVNGRLGGLSPELMTEVSSVLSKLIHSLNRNYDPKLIPIIQGLQASINPESKNTDTVVPFRTFDEFTSKDESLGFYPSSKIPWKIRAARKRAIKHHTTGMTKDEFDQIKQSLNDSAQKFTSIPQQSFALARNKSEGAIRFKNTLCSITLEPEPQKPIQHPSETGYSSDVCDYNVTGEQKPLKKISTQSAPETKDLILPDETTKSPRTSRSTLKTGSAVKARIARRKLMRQANSIDNPQGSLSDQESIENEESKQEDNSLKPVRKDWNSRFSNIKNSFVPSEEDSSNKSRSPSLNPDETLKVQERSSRAPSKEDKNKFNAKVSVKNDERYYAEILARARSESTSSKLKQPEKKNPRTNGRLSKSLPRESRAEALGMEPSNKHSNDMEYQEYMNIIDKVRRTKESTRARTEQFRLASMYAQEKKRQDELRKEEERLASERLKIEKERQMEVSKMHQIGVEKGILDKKESESPPNKVEKNQELKKEVAIKTEQEKFELLRAEQKRQRELREEQVKAEQDRLARLRQESIKQEKEREEIRLLEQQRLRQIQEEQKKLENERQRQEETIRLEQVKLEEERKRQETLQAERNAEYNRQRLSMEAQHCRLPPETRARLMSPVVAVEAPKLSPEEKIIQERLALQEKLRAEHKKTECKIREEKLKLIQQEEMLISRQEEMLRQVESERANLLKQEELIRSRQQGRLEQVRQEKMLLEKQEEMLNVREDQLVQERLRQEKLRMERKALKEQEEVIRKRQEQISKELMGDITICDAREGKVFTGKPKNFIYPSISGTSYESNSEEEEENGEEEEEFYETKIEVQEKPTSIPTSVRTIESINAGDKPWAPVTPYLSNIPSTKNQDKEMQDLFKDGKYKSGIITSPESIRTSETLITTPDTSLQMSCLATPDGSPPPIPPLPFDTEPESFFPVQPDVPPRLSSYRVVASMPSSPRRPSPLRQSLISVPINGESKNNGNNLQLSPSIGGPDSAFKPYASSENLFDPFLFSLPPKSNGTESQPKEILKKPVYSKVKELKRHIKPPFTTTDTEPEMKECTISEPKKKAKVLPKPHYSTSETEEEAYHLRSRNKKNNKPIYDVVDSPPQITQKPVGFIQKPKPTLPSKSAEESVTPTNIKTTPNTQRRTNAPAPPPPPPLPSRNVEISKTIQPLVEEKVAIPVRKISIEKQLMNEEILKKANDRRQLSLDKHPINRLDVSKTENFQKTFQEIPQKRNPRNNPTIVAMEIMTRKETRACELEKQMANDYYKKIRTKPMSAITPMVQTKKPSNQQQPVIILKKEPKRLGENEIEERQNVQKGTKVPKVIPKEAKTSDASNVITRTNKVLKTAEKFEKNVQVIEVKNKIASEKLPWISGKDIGYSLRTSKSSDSITAARKLGLSLVPSSSSSDPSGVYAKTREEIRQIIDVAKQSSVSERINLFNKTIAFSGGSGPSREDKAEAIKREIREAKASVNRVPERRKTLPIQEAPKGLRINAPQGSEASIKKINSVSSRIKTYNNSKTPKLLLESNTLQVYAQSATDMSAGEEEETTPNYSNNNSNLLTIPQTKSFGISKSKSFCTPGQFECVMSEEEEEEKRERLSSFFTQSRPPLKSALKKSGGLDEVELAFESLLRESFATDSCSERRKSVPKISFQDTTNIQDMNGKVPLNPLASLPTSHTKKYKHGPWNMEESPSPTRSEYDTPDPWEDY